MDKLTAKQEKYVLELIKGKTQRKAYRKAYPNSKKWKNESVDARACRLLKSDKVNARYKHLAEKVAKEAEEAAIVTAKDVLAELAKVGFSDITDFLDFGTKKVYHKKDIRDEKGKKIDTEYIAYYDNVIKMKNSKDINAPAAIKSVSLTDKGKLAFVLHDKVRSLEMIGKYLGMFVDRVEDISNEDLIINIVPASEMPEEGEF